MRRYQRLLGRAYAVFVASEITALWCDIEAWLRDHAPTTAAAIVAAPVDAYDQVSAYLGRELPEAVREYICVTPTLSGGHMLFGSYASLSPEGMIRKSALEIEADLELHGDETSLPGPAGAFDERWSPDFLPITYDGSGNTLVVDLRAGPSHGCVMRWPNIYRYGLEWHDLAEFLTETRDCLRESKPFLRHHLPTTADGELRWVFIDAPTPGGQADGGRDCRDHRWYAEDARVEVCFRCGATRARQ